MKILFVCTGNTCRSPIAEGLFKKMLKTKGIEGVEVTSAGLFAVGEAISKNAHKALLEVECDDVEQYSRSVTPMDVAESDRIYCMTENHRDCLIRGFPQFAHKIEVLGDGIFDPFNGSLEIYRLCRDEIKSKLEKVLEWVEANAN